MSIMSQQDSSHHSPSGIQADGVAYQLESSGRGKENMVKYMPEIILTFHWQMQVIWPPKLKWSEHPCA